MMAVNEKTAADLTMTQLEAFVRKVVVETLTEEDNETLIDLQRPERRRSYDEISAALDRHMIYPQPGTPSVVEMIREDRDR